MPPLFPGATGSNLEKDTEATRVFPLGYDKVATDRVGRETAEANANALMAELLEDEAKEAKKKAKAPKVILRNLPRLCCKHSHSRHPQASLAFFLSLRLS
jgi:hypothetical protein